MKYLLIEHADGGDPKVVSIFDSVDARAIATREAILGPPDNDNENLQCHDLLTLADEGIVQFEGDPSIEWMDAEVQFADHTESLRLLSLCLGRLRVTDQNAPKSVQEEQSRNYESACSLCGVKPYEQEEPK